MLLFLLAGGWVLKLAVGETYVGFGFLLVLLWLGKLVFFLYRLNAVRRRTQGATQVVPLSYLAGCIALTLMAFPLITRLGSSGAAWSYILSGVVILIAQEIAYYRIRAQGKSGK